MILTAGQIEFVEGAPVPEANRCSPVAFGEFVQITLLGSAVVLSKCKGAMFLVQQASGTVSKCCLSLQSAGHCESPIDDDPVNLPIATEKGFEVWHRPHALHLCPTLIWVHRPNLDEGQK